ncbi:MAG: hypothetical protein GY853_13260 [PVC group bacterium]|nr:hypothetical protein [PVC group bacterium]
MKELFNRVEVTKILGIKEWLYNTTVERGLVKPYVKMRGGEGVKFSYGNLVKLGMILKMKELGLPWGIIKHALYTKECKLIRRDKKWDTIYEFGDAVLKCRFNFRIFIDGMNKKIEDTCKNSTGFRVKKDE